MKFMYELCADTQGWPDESKWQHTPTEVIAVQWRDMPAPDLEELMREMLHVTSPEKAETLARYLGPETTVFIRESVVLLKRKVFECDVQDLIQG